MIDALMFIKTDIDQSVVAAPTVRMYDRVQRNTSANNLLQRISLHIGHNLGKDKAIALVNAEDDVFAKCAATAPSAHTASAEIGFVNARLRMSRKAKPPGKQQRVEHEFSKRWSWLCAAKCRLKLRFAKHSNPSQSNE